MKLLGMLEHRVTPVRRDDGQLDVGPGLHRGLMGPAHGPRVEGGDLVVILIGHDHGLRGVAIGQLADELRADPHLLEPLGVACAVAAHRGHGQWHTAELMQAIGDIASAAAEFATQLRHQKRHIEDVQLLGQDLLGKAARKTHDGVEGKRSANQCRHGQNGVEVKRNAPRRGAEKTGQACYWQRL